MHDLSGIEPQTVCIDGQDVVLRLLAENDVAALADYFEGLSERTRSFYAPHPFDRSTAEAICRELSTPDGSCPLRLVAVADGAIVGYFILIMGLNESDRKRRYTDLDPETACTLAPSIADAWQNRGLGSNLMSYAGNCAHSMGRTIMVLSGGVQERNARAVHFYTKAGFRKVGEFATSVTHDGETTSINNFDMMLRL